MSLSHLYGKGSAAASASDDDVEMERFEITDWDLENEFNPNRQRHWQTKEEATYGMWAERDSDDERPSFGGKRCGAGAPPPHPYMSLFWAETRHLGGGEGGIFFSCSRTPKASIGLLGTPLAASDCGALISS